MSSLVQIEDLRLSFAGREVLHGVSLEVRQGETVALVGESGSGKSSTIRSLLNLYPDTATHSGTASVDGVDALSASAAALHGLRSRVVSMVHQDPRSSLNPVRTVGDSVMERLVHVHGVPVAQARTTAVELLEQVGIRDAAAKLRLYPHAFSGGMLQRVAIAAALTVDPRVLLADEATSALDVTTQAEVLSVLRRLQRERELAVLMVTHDLHLAAAFCDRVYVMLHGTVVEEIEGNRLFSSAEHDYTRHLLEAAPHLKRRTA
jgi:peptide/nickel transport system ATP-binding protein